MAGVTADVGTVIKKAGLSMASSGSVTFNFARRGRLTVNSEVDEEALLDLAIGAGLDGDVELAPVDAEGRGDDPAKVRCVVLTEPTELGAMQAALQEAGHECSGVLVYVPLAPVECSEDDETENYACIDKLEEIDDVTSVEHNMVAG